MLAVSLELIFSGLVKGIFSSFERLAVFITSRLIFALSKMTRVSQILVKLH